MEVCVLRLQMGSVVENMLREVFNLNKGKLISIRVMIPKLPAGQIS